MVLALGAGKLFDLDHEGELEDTIVSKCVDTYIALSDAALTSDVNQPTQLNTAFPSTANGATIPIFTPRQYKYVRSGGCPAPTTALPPSFAQQRGIQKPLQAVIDQLFERCFRDRRYRPMVGAAVEAREFDVIRRAVLRASDDEKGNKPAKDGIGQVDELLEYLLGICMDVVQERGLRQELLRLILCLLRCSSPDVFSIAKCIVYLNEHSMASKLLAVEI
ncbi:hypothetical protein HO173_003327 [Letharia columbiana]|uniref:26S proteasome non-ATPase regulatory subunit 1/RPN2 N-terminal domain-containing protein n=1 Tax=Letharia columbiana TaxID=112416 RepID=A0A8H6G1T9_9LECA|nr:uncharacterized protein HO173_003327 [Letharia columbiana]KAF6238820.1 hypothetical protein HO173_003327 [Letharia columbiana]